MRYYCGFWYVFFRISLFFVRLIFKEREDCKVFFFETRGSFFFINDLNLILDYLGLDLFVKYLFSFDVIKVFLKLRKF